MKILAIDTSSDAASAAVADDEKLLAEYTVNNKKKTHSQKIMVMVDAVLRDAGLDISDIDLFAAVNGPGSFTGIRIGVAAAKAFAHACGKPAVGVNSLESLAYNLPFCEHIIVPVMAAGKNRVYTASYIYDGIIKELEAPEPSTIEECAAGCGELLDVAFVGDGAAVHREYLKEMLGDKAFFAPPGANLQRASSAAYCAFNKFKNGATGDYHELEPLYLKKSQAEQELDRKRKGQKQ